MKFSVTTYGTQGVISPEELMPKLAEFGYDGIEIWAGDLPGAEHMAWYRQDSVRISEVWEGQELTEAEVARLDDLKGLAAQYDLAIPTISTYFDFTAGEQRWQESLAVGRRYIQYALALGSPTIRTCAGRIGSADVTEAHWQACISGLKALTSLPDADQVIFALECHPHRPEDTISSILREVEEVGADNLRIILQPTSFAAEASTEEILDALYEHTVHIHAHTGMRGSSEVDWAWLLPEMVRRGYEGFLSLEGIEEPELASIEREIEWLKEVAGD